MQEQFFLFISTNNVIGFQHIIMQKIQKSLLVKILGLTFSKSITISTHFLFSPIFHTQL
jgi:hypothetical protein